MKFQLFPFHSAASSASTMTATPHDDHHGGRGDDRRFRQRGNMNKKWSMTAFSLFLAFMACVTFMANPVSSAVMTLDESAEICGQTLTNTDGYVIEASFDGDIECDGSGPTLIGSVFDCAGKSIKYIGSNPSGNNGLDLQNGSAAMNCIVSGFQNGIVVSNSATRVTVTSCESRENIQGVEIKREVDAGVFFANCEIRNSTSHGAAVYSKRKVSFDGGVIEYNGGNGILASRSGSPGRMTIKNIQISNNDRYGVAIIGSQPSPVISGVILEKNILGSMFLFGTKPPKVSCSNLFGKVRGSIIAGDGVCYSEDSCGDRSSECADSPLIVTVAPAEILSPAEFCGATLPAGTMMYELDPDEIYSCGSEGGVTLNDGNTLDCKNTPVVGDGTSTGTIGISVISGAASITNCEVSGFNIGVVGTGSALITVSASKMNNNIGIGLYVETGDATVMDSEANGNGSIGFFGFYGSASGSLRLESVIATNNGDEGISAAYLPPYNGDLYVKDSVVTNNGEVGIRILDNVNYFEVEGCEVSGSDGNDLGGILIQGGVTGGIINNSYVTGGGRGIQIRSFNTGTVAVSCSEVTTNYHTNNVDGEGIAAFNSAASLEITNSMVHDHYRFNVYGENAAFSLDNVYACGSRDTTDIQVTPTAPDGSSAVCDNGAAGGGACATDCSSGVTEESFAADLVSSGDCPDFGWWNDE